MRLLVVTNNPKIEEQLKGQAEVECLPLQGLIDVLTKCKSLLDEGWKLECDPLAGYISRPIPYHSILLSMGSTRRDSEYFRDLAAIDTLINKYIENKEWYDFHSATPQRRADHMAIDSSIAGRIIGLVVGRGV